MNSIDKLKLLAGLPIEMPDNSFSVYPALLRDIATIGEGTFFKYLNLLTLKESEIKSITGINVKTFDFLFFNATENEKFKKEFLDALSFFIKEPLLMVNDQGIIIIGDFSEGRILGSYNYGDFQEIIKAQNFLDTDVIKHVGDNEAARRIKERLRKGREKVEQLKKERDEQSVEFVDIVG